jgi:hypothetical protein
MLETGSGCSFQSPFSAPLRLCAKYCFCSSPFQYQSVKTVKIGFKCSEIARVSKIGEKGVGGYQTVNFFLHLLNVSAAGR